MELKQWLWYVTALEDHTTRGIPYQTIDRVTTGSALKIWIQCTARAGQAQISIGVWPCQTQTLDTPGAPYFVSLIEVELEKTSANTNCRWSRSRPAFLKVHTHCVLPPNFICTILPNVEGFQHPRLLQQCSVYM